MVLSEGEKKMWKFCSPELSSLVIRIRNVLFDELRYQLLFAKNNSSTRKRASDIFSCKLVFINIIKVMLLVIWCFVFYFFLEVVDLNCLGFTSASVEACTKIRLGCAVGMFVRDIKVVNESEKMRATHMGRRIRALCSNRRRTNRRTRNRLD